MTIGEYTRKAKQLLEEASIPSAQLDAEILLADTLNKDRSWIIAHADDELPLQGPSLQRLDEQVRRRVSHEPIAYIRGKQEFFGREFVVSPDTLTPRPETETMVELALEILSKQDITTVADIGTGSGCIIITLQLESHKTGECTGYDISEPAIKIARRNAKKLSAQVDFEVRDLAQDTEKPWQNAELLVANLPYVPDDFHINLAASHEPAFAIFGGEDGLDHYRTLFSQMTKANCYILTESLPPQHEKLQEIAETAGYQLDKTQDFIQVFSRKETKAN